ncbi:P-loop containing nucleoside triphosphate hydrolase protein [Hyaloraphidium curvatum]|nr:P-loop containing nucleoside triphosphate hydrolase protein [Hyaloraphidium curvatum]
MAAKVAPNGDVALDMRLPTSASLAPPSGVEVRFSDLSYTVDVPDKEAKKPKFPNPFARTPLLPKRILDSVSGIFEPGKLTAIMGASGAGKTSLLQVLAGEAKAGHIAGSLLINGRTATPKELKNLSGLVFQDDVILQTMTVREALTMAAILRLPSDYTKPEREQRVVEVLEMLKLEKAADTIVGNSELKGISGGERKRLAIGMELISNPPLLWADEPTSGLDAFTANKVVEILRDLAHSGRTVVATVHQPSAETFFMFDDLLLLSQGRIMYHGPVNGLLEHFEALGYPVPLYSNPIDYIFMHVLSVFTSTPYPATMKHPDPTAMEPAETRINRLLDAWPTTPAYARLQARFARPPPSTDPSATVKSTRSIWIQIGYLAKRTAKNVIRNEHVVKTKTAQAIIFGLIMGLTYLDLPSKDPAAAMQNYSGVLFFMAMIQVMNNATGILNVFGEEKAVFRRESGSGYYGLPAFFISKIIVETPMAMFFAVLLSTIMYWLIGLPANAASYFISMIICALSAVSGMFIGIMLASIFDSLQVALSLTPMILTPLMLFSGLFVNSGTIPAYFAWIRWISPVKYGFEGLVKQLTPQFVVPLGFDDGLSVAAICGILVAFSAILMGISYLGLWRVTYFASRSAKWQRVDKSAGSKEVAAAGGATIPRGDQAV